MSAESQEFFPLCTPQILWRTNSHGRKEKEKNTDGNLSEFCRRRWRSDKTKEESKFIALPRKRQARRKRIVFLWLLPFSAAAVFREIQNRCFCSDFSFSCLLLFLPLSTANLFSGTVLAGGGSEGRGEEEEGGGESVGRKQVQQVSPPPPPPPLPPPRAGGIKCQAKKEEEGKKKKRRMKVQKFPPSSSFSLLLWMPHRSWGCCYVRSSESAS